MTTSDQDAAPDVEIIEPRVKSPLMEGISEILEEMQAQLDDLQSEVDYGVDS
jgi:hypothetical protein